ncbi:probable E3 ubiquitin-protein ligase ARI2 [Lycium ferocissimum]|uniref:probable E3 ubiquitin-protein ligase ARI2 n=1 Tax=Lycium ferocissimum TaxID=112874 RepID=UPI0028162F7A|nr:probable E3 ubiquitin-protein ligase ARI2 [Lycium ferocissimum]
MAIDDMYGSSDEEYYNGGYDDEYESDYDRDPEPESDDDLACGKAPSCRVIRKESLLAAQKEDLQRVVDLLSLKEHHARTLLIHYQWDVDKVFAIFVERGKEKLYAEAGVTLEEKDENPATDPSTEFTCEICFEDFPAEQTTLMECDHRFCNDCWTEYFIVKINDGKSRRITCMAQKCKTICDEGKIRDLVTTKDPNLAEKFDRFILESYIEDNKRVKWCPSVPHCGNAIRVEDDEYCEVECACGQQFCFNCLCELHSPCSCAMWDLWLKKCDDEAPTVTWLSEKTKHCPKCHKIVEKDGGCNLVTCMCGQPFCWLCGGATGLEHTWNSIAGHTCGRYKASHLKSEDNVEGYWRLTHYFGRYKAHIDSLKIEASETKQKILDKVCSLEAKEFLQLKDFSWAMSGFYRLGRSRRVVANSYPFAYYYFGDLFANEITKEERGIKQNLFEDQQQQLETNIERLSMFLEEPFANYPEDKLVETRMKIITLSTVTDDLCKNLYECIDNDLLVPLQQTTHTIARYRSKGVEKASEL